MLGSIQTLVEPVPDNYAKTIDRLKDLVTAMQLSAGHQRSSTTLEAASIHILRRLPRAELTSFVLPTVEEYLGSYKSSQDAELKGIRKNLDRIVSVSGHPLLGDTLRNNAKDSQEPTVGILESELHDDPLLPRNRFPNQTSDKPSDVNRSELTSSHNDLQR